MNKIYTDQFEQARPRLLGLAYRLLGSSAEAEDVVQDAFIKWQATDKQVIRNADAWLTTCCTRLCLDVIKSARRSRTQYVGPWLPEPLHTAMEQTPETELILSSSLTTAFLMVLERLTPRERAAYLLYEIFKTSYEDIAKMLDIQPATCRKLVSRARRYVGQEKIRSKPSTDTQQQMLAAFQTAIATGSVQSLGQLLAEDIELRADSGGKVIAVLDVLSGREQVLDFIQDTLSAVWNSEGFDVLEINGALGLTLTKGSDILASISFGYTAEGLLENIFIMRNPDKLQRLAREMGPGAAAERLFLH